MTKKEFQKIFLFFASIIFSLHTIAASSFSMAKEIVGEVFDSILGILAPILEGVIGDYSSSEFFFAKVLLLVLLIVIINFVLKKAIFKKKDKNLAMLVAVIVSILAIRFISENQLITGILLPYGTIGVALTAIIPFLIFFYFIYMTKMGSFGRRISWAFFGIVFFALWFSRSDLSPVMNQIYGWTMFAIVLAFLFDKRFRRYFKTWEANQFFKSDDERTIASLQAEYYNISDVDTPEAESRREFLKRRIKELKGKLP